jgi:hypothetical protein
MHLDTAIRPAAHTLTRAALSLAAAALLLAASPASGQLDDKAAEAAIKAALKAVPKTQQAQLKTVVSEVSTQVKDEGKAISSGASAPGAGVTVLTDATSQLHEELTQFTNLILILGVDGGLADVLAQTDGVPAGALVGSGGTLDKTLDKLEKQHRAALAKGRKALASLVKALVKQSVPAAVRGPEPVLLGVAPGSSDPGGGGGGELTGDGAALPLALPPLTLDALIGSSDADVPGDGVLQVRGTVLVPGDPVTVSGAGPEGAAFGPLVAVTEASGEYGAEVTGLAEGNWRVQVAQGGVLVADYVGLPGAPDPGTDALDAKALSKSAKQGWNAFAKQHGKDANVQVKNLAERLKAAQAVIKEDGHPPMALEDAFLALELFQRFMDEATNEDLGGAAGEVFGQALDTLDQLVPDHLVGDGLASDKAATKIEKRCLAAAVKARKSARTFAKWLAKNTDWRLSVDLEPTLFRRVAPVKGPELPALLAPLRVDLVMGASHGIHANDGILWLRVTGDPALGPEIVISLHGPGGVQQDLVVPSGDAADGVTLRIPDTGPGTLPEGNYLIVLSQGAAQASAAISVPGAP